MKNQQCFVLKTLLLNVAQVGPLVTELQEIAIGCFI